LDKTLPFSKVFDPDVSVCLFISIEIFLSLKGSQIALAYSSFQEGIMKTKPVFSKRFFELEYPKLLKLTDSDGNQPCVVIVLGEGTRIPLRQFELAEGGVRVNVSSGEYLISYDSIVSVQVIPQALRKILSSPARHAVPIQGPTLIGIP
jgi:hypothetical protein